MHAKLPPRTLLVSAACLLSAACATMGTSPNERMESSSAAILAAETGGAAHSADADRYLALAKDQFMYAQNLPNPHDRDRVDRLLRRAQVDAELSLALAQGEDQKAAAQAAIDRVTKLNREATK
jgi:hypothetical protein